MYKDTYKKTRGRFYVAFVDFSTTFDCVDISLLLKKLKRYGMTDELLNILKNIYSDVRATVRNNNEFSDDILSSVGLKQGCKLSPTLFSIYINDLVDRINNDPKIKGIQIHPAILQISILLFC